MYRHTSTGLRGPVSRNRTWWKCPGADAAQDAPGRPRTAPDDIRPDLVARVRREIAEGRYETPDKWLLALDRLAARLGRP